MSIQRLIAACTLALALTLVGTSSPAVACGPPTVGPVFRPGRPVARVLRAIVRPGRPHPVLRAIRRVIARPLQ